MKISVVVPVFNVEKYLRRCLESLSSQTYKDLEIIMVNDGSTDNSQDICDEYVERDKRFKLIVKANGGLSDARNKGFEIATGEYILFIDSDDYIANNSIEEFVELIYNYNCPDIIIGSYLKVTDEQTVSDTCCYTNAQLMKGEEYLLKCYSKNENIMITAWSKIYKRTFLRENNLSFRKGIVHEDELFTPNAILKSKRIVVSDLSFYRYCIREGSIMTAKNQIKNAKSVYLIVHELDKIYANVKDSTLKKYLRNHSATIYYQALSKILKSDAYKEYLIDKDFLKRNSISTKNKIRYLFLNLSFDSLKKLT